MDSNTLSYHCSQSNKSFKLVPIPKNLSDLTGKQFGYWTVIGLHDCLRRGKHKWLAKCHCGKVKPVNTTNIRSGKSQSCGCMKGRLRVRSTGTHGMSKTRFYRIWRQMIARCHDPKNSKYYNYGARGITVCDRWRCSFANFMHDMYENYSDSLSIDRIDNYKGYSPDNCRWATPSQQAWNRRDNRIISTPLGDMPLGKAALISGIHPATLSQRERNGWSAERIFNPPDPRHQSA